MKVFRSIWEVRQHYFPNYDRCNKYPNRWKVKPENTGTGLVEQLIENMRKALREAISKA